MAAGTLVDLLVLEFSCPAGRELLLEILQAAAQLMQKDDTQLSFRHRSSGGALTDRSSGAEAEEVWEGEGVRIRLRTRKPEGNRSDGSPPQLVGSLELDDGFHMEATVRLAPGKGSTMTVRLQRLWPRHFDHIRELFRRRLGAECDATDAPAVALQNLRAALAAAQGAFARYLMDQATSWRRAHPDPVAEEEWSLLQELTRDLRQGGPEKPEDEAPPRSPRA